MDRNFVTITVIILIAAFAWIGITIYSADTKVETNPNASTYTAFLSPDFDRDTLSQLQNRIDTYLPIKTDEYKNLKVPDLLQTPTNTTDQTQVDGHTSVNPDSIDTTPTPTPTDGVITPDTTK